MDPVRGKRDVQAGIFVVSIDGPVVVGHLVFARWILLIGIKQHRVAVPVAVAAVADDLVARRASARIEDIIARRALQDRRSADRRRDAPDQ